MSQNTSMLVTKEFPESIPKDVIHFFDNGYLLLPIDYMDVTSLVDHFVRFNSLEELIAETKDDYLDVIEIIAQLKLRTFVLFHYSEHGDCPIDFYQLVVKEGEILQHTVKNVDENDAYYAETMLNYFTTESDFDVSNYGDYKSSFSRYQANLYWDENPAYEILASLPAYGPMYHSVTHTGVAFHSEGFVVRFYNPDKTNWVANFQPGITSLNTIVDLDRHLFLVISGGACYIMHPGLKNPISNFGDSYEVILKRKNGGYVLQDSTRLTIVEANGAYWHSVQISYDGIKEFSLDENGLVKGVSYYPTPDDDEWIPFTYDIEKRKLIGGSFGGDIQIKKWWNFGN